MFAILLLISTDKVRSSYHAPPESEVQMSGSESQADEISVVLMSHVSKCRRFLGMEREFPLV